MASFACWVAPVARAQQQTTPDRATPLSMDFAAYRQFLDNGYSDWTGADARLTYRGDRVAPFATVSTQSRREGRQESYGLGSYLFLTPTVYSIVDFSVATGGTAVFFPRLRWDASVLADTRVVPGLVVDAGFTYVTFGGGSTGTITSLGPIYYRGPWIVSGLGHLNHDGQSGVTTGSGEVAAQRGAEGRSWTGASLSAGHEAYQVVSLTPFDAEFTNLGGSIFHQHWVGPRSALLGRIEVQRKSGAYTRRGVTLSYRVAF
jgi:YaiO family outer membrane protein